MNIPFSTTLAHARNAFTPQFKGAIARFTVNPKKMTKAVIARRIKNLRTLEDMPGIRGARIPFSFDSNFSHLVCFGPVIRDNTYSLLPVDKLEEVLQRKALPEPVQTGIWFQNESPWGPDVTSFFSLLSALHTVWPEAQVTHTLENFDPSDPWKEPSVMGIIRFLTLREGVWIGLEGKVKWVTCGFYRMGGIEEDAPEFKMRFSPDLSANLPSERVEAKMDRGINRILEKMLCGLGGSKILASPYTGYSLTFTVPNGKPVSDEILNKTQTTLLEEEYNDPIVVLMHEKRVARTKRLNTVENFSERWQEKRS